MVLYSRLDFTYASKVLAGSRYSYVYPFESDWNYNVVNFNINYLNNGPVEKFEINLA